MKRLYSLIIALIIVHCIPTFVVALDKTTLDSLSTNVNGSNLSTSDKALIVEELIQTKNKELDNTQKALEDFKGLGFGVALTYTHDTGAHKRVVDAKVINGVVRITEDSNDIIRFMLETHYFFPFKGDHFFGSKETSGWGPFIAFSPSSDGQGPITAIGGGIMLGWRRDKQKSDSFNLGIGGVVDTSVNVLGDGIEENKPLPAGETEVRYKKTSQGGLFVSLSFAF